MGLVIALVDVLSGEIVRGLTDTDLAAAVELLDLLVNLLLVGWTGYHVATALGDMRSGLEAAVIGGLIAGAGGLAYQLTRGTETPTTTYVVSLVAWNIVLAAGAGALGAWTGAAARRGAPPGSRDSS